MDRIYFKMPVVATARYIDLKRLEGSFMLFRNLTEKLCLGTLVPTTSFMSII